MEQIYAEDMTPSESLGSNILENGCKISWKITSTQQIKKDISGLDCYWKLQITLDNKMIISWSDQYWECVWMETIFPIYKPETWSYYPKKWEYIYSIVDKVTSEIILYWKESYENYLEIPMCNPWELKTYPENSLQKPYFSWIILFTGAIIVGGVLGREFWRK